MCWQEYLSHGIPPQVQTDGQEINKFIPQVFRYFDLKLAHPEREWRTTNRWFIVQKDVEVIFTQRKKVDLQNV